MTIGEHISAIRGLINAYSEREAPFSDEALYHYFRVAASYLTRQKYDRYNRRNMWNAKTYCVALERDSIHNCDCLPTLCEVMKTVYKIPKPLSGRGSDFLRVMTIDHRDIARINPSFVDGILYDPIRKNKLHYAVVDEHIVIYNGNPEKGLPKAILVQTYPENPVEWSGIQACDTNGNSTGSSCYNIKSDDYPIDDDLVDAAYTMVVRKLGITLQIPEDRVNEGS